MNLRRVLGLFLLRNGVAVPSLVRSVQRGSITIAGANTSNTDTLSQPVNLDHAVIRFLGCRVAGNENPDHAFGRIELTDENTVTAVKNAGSPGADDVTVGYEVTEYVPGVLRSVQRGTIACAAGSATDTIDAVNRDKTELYCLGVSTAGGTVNTWLPELDLQDETTVRARSTAADATVGYQAVERW